MKAHLKILSGSRAGQVEVHSRNEITVGRHPSCDLRFHPDLDLDVSTRHSVIARSGNGWIVRDLQSRNGTLVNGHRIGADTRLDNTDQIRFGAAGPTVEFRAVNDSVADTVAPLFETATAGPRLTTGGHGPGPAQAAPAVRSATPRSGGTTQRIKIEVAKQTQTLRWTSVGLITALVIAVGGFYAYNKMGERQRQAEVEAIQTRTNETLQAFQAQLQGLTEALQRSQDEVKRLQTDLASAQATGDRTQIAELSKRLDDASTALRNQQQASQIDYRGINVANQKSVALIYAKFANDSVFTGTAFAVRNDGIMITNRHVVSGEGGTRPAIDMALRFADSPQTFKASLVSVSPDADLALVRVERLEGTVPVVRGINARPDGVQVGDPVAMIGFPLGVELPMGRSGTSFIPKTTFGPGTVSKVLSDRIQVDGYSAQGASGSPIFDRNGDVVAVLYGGQEGTNGRVLYAVPATYVAKLLQTLK